MKRLLNRRSIMLTIVLLLGAIPVAAVERPFALNGRGVAAFITDSAGNIIGANVTASGTATHLGLWTTVGTVTFTPDNGVLRSHAEVTLTAANGDKLESVVDGALNPATGTDHGNLRFVGGTGRFQGASGNCDSLFELQSGRTHRACGLIPLATGR
jgi:sugar (pentulose or hexulose) kinase